MDLRLAHHASSDLVRPYMKRISDFLGFNECQVFMADGQGQEHLAESRLHEQQSAVKKWVGTIFDDAVRKSA